MIPACIDYRAIVEELVDFGYGPHKIDLVCGFYEGAAVRLLDGRVCEMSYERTARLYNFWWDERARRGLEVLTPRVPLVPVYMPVALATT